MPAKKAKTKSRVGAKKTTNRKKPAPPSVTKRGVAAKQKKAEPKFSFSSGSKKVLGRGLSALMAVDSAAPLKEPSFETKKEAPDFIHETAESNIIEMPARAPASREEGVGGITPEDSESQEGLAYLPLAKIRPNPEQPRRTFDAEELNSLAASLKESGMLQPVLVRKVERDFFEIIAGERRWRAANQAGLAQIPVIVRDLSDQEVLEIGLVENIQRADLNPIEEAEAFSKLIVEFGQTQAQVASAVGRDRASVANSLRLLKLSPMVRDYLSEGKLSAGHGRALLMIEDPGAQRRLAERALAEQLSVRELERIASPKEKTSKPGKRGKSSTSTADVGIMEIEDRLRRALGTKVKVQANTEGQGQITINFFSTDELARLLDTLGA